MSQRLRAVAVLALLGAVLLPGCSKKNPTQPSSLESLRTATPAHSSGETPTVVMSSGAIEADVAAFRTALGDPNNASAVGQQPGGRREVNWDGVPPEFTNSNDFPPDFFNTTVTRGLFYNRGAGKLRVSDNGYTDINSGYAGVFNTFSAAKLFSPVGRNDVDVRFRIAGSDEVGAVNGVGVVFADVDRLGSTTIELEGEHGLKLGQFTAPVRTDERGLSFLGVKFSGPMITRMRIFSGNGELGSHELDITQGGRHDLVVMDNFIYGEPSAVDHD